MEDRLIDFLKNLGFVLDDKNFIKNYNGYKISISHDTCLINYGNKIKNDRGTTLNLAHQDETMVVLECVDRLLTLGYLPESITLEKHYDGLWLDILVCNKNTPFLMIECKRPDKYNNELSKMENNGGQLFSYYTADRTPKLLCLYTSNFNNETKRFLYYSNIIRTDNIKGNNKKELYESWDKTFEKNGIFEPNTIPYSIEFHGIKKCQLKPFSKYDINPKEKNVTIFNRFSEILRRHSISDKNNAYNKIFNLFLCKIVDEEERKDNEYTWFQWRDCESAIEVISRLEELYKKGMNKYLKLEITDVSENELCQYLTGINNSNKDLVLNLFRQLRLYKSSEFSFLEVINERTFGENVKIVKEVVKMLEEYQIKYSSKQQFLGDFFEKLLNIGVKQEAGQFFTPIPIANFIVNSIPYEEIILRKIKKGDCEFLPYTIDFSCGSGHFLTEAMERVDNILKNNEYLINANNAQIAKWNMWKQNYSWAKEFIYGIELDYRLAKTTKVAGFLNGDGEANIFYANGLNDFKSDTYYSKLKSSNYYNKNEKFDVVIANPPYSVKDFKKQLNNFDKTFSLSDYITDSSDDIETVFVERTWQLLNDNGYCGIILPDTILTNASPMIFPETRKFILKYFDVVAITNLGEQTFIKTGQTTAVLFMKKRSKSYVDTISNNCFNIIDNIISNESYFNEALSEYVKEIYSFDDLKSYRKKLVNKNIIKEEKQKFCIYELNKSNKVILANTGKRQDEIEFLGYKHTDMKNYEGIRPYPDNDENIINSRLYNENNIHDKTKVSKYIYDNFLNETIDEKNINENHLDKNVRYEKLIDLISLKDNLDEENKDDYMIVTRNIREINCPNSEFELKSLGDIVGNNNISSGEVAPQPRYFLSDQKKDCIFIRAKHLNNIEDRYIRLKPENYFVLDRDRILYKKGTIVFPKSGQSVNTNNISLIPKDSYVVNHLATIYTEDENLRDYIYYILKIYKTSNLKLTDTGYPTIRVSTIRSFKIPYPKNRAKMIEIVKILNGISRVNKTKEKIEKEEQEILLNYGIIL